jgi:cell division protein ZipA
MNELRWILLAAGAVLIAGIYVWGLRARRRAAAPEPDRMTRVEPARTVPVVAEPPRVEPEVRIEEPAIDGPVISAADEVELEEPAIRRPVGGASRREPRIEPRFDGRFEPTVTTSRVEPRFEPEAATPAGPQYEAPAAAAAEPPRKAPAQKIVAVRVVATPGGQFAGAQLLEAVQADGFTFGRYQIFHRLDATGRPVVSLASLKEPGTFDPDAMPGSSFRGVALFAVMPGPLPALQAFDELIVTARALASTLGGQLQDERGVPLSLQRVGHLREEVAEFERARGVAPGG